MMRTIDGRRYLMRDTRPVRELRALHLAFCKKYQSRMGFHEWLVERGKVYMKRRK